MKVSLILNTANACVINRVIFPTFEENGIFMLGVVFFIQSIFADRNNSFRQNFLYPIEDIDFLSSNVKRYFTSDYFL